MKTCTKCGKEKRLDEFAWNRFQGKRYKRTQCKRCCADYTKYIKTNPPPKRVRYTPEERQAKRQEWSRRSNLKNCYGLTEKQYQEMFARQNGVCAICGKPETSIHGHSKRVKALSVDHDHATGQVRELLCSRCNRKVMYIESTPELITYLMKHRSASIVDLLPFTQQKGH